MIWMQVVASMWDVARGVDLGDLPRSSRLEGIALRVKAIARNAHLYTDHW